MALYHVYIRQEFVAKTRAFTVHINCAQPLLVWDPIDPEGGHMIDPRALAEACADAVAANLEAQFPGKTCRSKAAPGTAAPCGTLVG